MTEKNVFELLLDAVHSSSATFDEKIKILNALNEYIEYKYQQAINIKK
jgi:hypothetical protein